MVEPAVLRSGLEHGVLAADLVGKGRHAELVLDAAHHVQVRHAGFDHHHVSTFGDVHGDFAQGFVGVAGVHLIGFFIGPAKVGSRAHCIPERAVKRRCIFRAVSHDAGVNAFFGLQRCADGGNAAVHHVAGRDDVHTGFGLGQRLLDQCQGGLVIHDVAGFIGQAILAVGGERVQRHIGHHAQLGKVLFQRAYDAGNQAIRVVRFAPVKSLE